MDSIRYRGNDAEWIGRKYKGTIYGEGTAQPVDNWDCNERGVRETSMKITRRGVSLVEAGPRKLAIPRAGEQRGFRRNAQPGRPGWPPESVAPGPQSWAEEDD